MTPLHNIQSDRSEVRAMPSGPGFRASHRARSRRAPWGFNPYRKEALV